MKEDLTAKLASLLDPRQLDAVLVDRNAVVSAGAGSGKTRVLAYRFWYLILTGKAEVENILTLTFTRKAASEMYDRIYSLLKSGAAESERARTGIENFEKAQISTIDSFCAQIARSGSFRYGIPRSFVQDERKLEEAGQRLAFEFLLEQQGNPTLEKYFYTVGFEELWRGLFAPLAETYFSVVREQDLPAMAERQIDALSGEFRQVRDRLREIAEEIGGMPRDVSDSVTAAAESCRRLLPWIETMGGNDGAGGEWAPAAGEYAAGQETANPRAMIGQLFGYRLPGGKTTREEVLILKELTAEGRDLRDRLIRLDEVLSEQDDYREMFRLLALFRERVVSEKRKTGIVSFSDIMEMAIDILTNDTETRNHYKRRFRYIMVDEFQDTNMLQKELIYLLGERNDRCVPGIPVPEELEPDKLFFVGDEKQSIYRFRGADVGVFKALIREIGGTGGKSLPLPSNYRSDPGLVSFFNDLFERVFVKGGPDYEAEFSPLSPGPGGSRGPLVKLLYKPYRNEADPESLHGDEAEGFRIARFIRDAVEGGSLTVRDEKTGAERAADYGDFALLMRSTGNQIIYERMFRRLGVPYGTQNIRSLFLEAPVNDIYCMLQSVVHPEDRAAYAGLLRSPFVNISDDSFVRHLLALEPDAFPFAPETLPPGASAADDEKYRAGRELYAEIRAMADHVPIRRILFTLWYSKGYRFSLLRNSSFHGYLEFYPYLVSLADMAESRGMNLSLFVDSLRANLGKYEKMEELPVERGETSGVKLMTIHKSKGLEFPVVIVANMGNSGAGSDGRGLYGISAEYGLTLRSHKREGGGKRTGHDVFFERVKDEERLREEAESRRLLYVACTRARDHLVLSGCHHRNNRSGENNHLNMVLNATGGPEGSSGLIEEIPDVTEEDIQRHGVRRETAGAADFARFYRRETAPVLSGIRREFSATELNRRWLEKGRGEEGPETGHAADRNTGRSADRSTDREAIRETLPAVPCDPLLKKHELEGVFGTLCHWFIEKGVREESGLLAPGFAAAPPEAAAVPPAEMVEPIPEECRGEILRDAGSLAARFFNSPLGELLREAEWRESEYPFMYRHDSPSGPRFIRGVFDLVFSARGKVILVDFKSDREFAADDYLVQLRIYVDAAAELFGRPVEALLFTLRDGESRPAALPGASPLEDSLFFNL